METITWIPEDDLVLKNAVEKGASLESLAKGAVQFSRQFSILELQERWHALLYDPDVSAEASLRMSELQESVSSLSPMSRRVGVSEGYKQVSGKRKEESVRGQYYAMRKRNCTGPCSSADLDFPSLQNYIGDGGGSQEQLFVDDYFSDNCMIGDPVTDDFEIPSDNCMIGDPVTDDFELPDGELDFSSMLNAETTSANMYGTANEFQCGDRGSFEGNFASEIMGGGCLNGFVENISPITANEAVQNDIDHSFDHDNLHKEMSHIRRDSGPLFNIKPENVCSGFSPPIPDSVASFSQYPEWGAGNVGPHEDDSMKGILPGYVRDCGDGLASSDATFGDISLDFLFVDDDNEKGMLDGSPLEGLTSMLFGSPYNISDPEESMALDTGSGVMNAASLVGFEVPLHPLTCKVDDSSIALSTTTSVPEPQSPYRINGVICCFLNTEDPEIPSNDDSFLSPSEVLPSYVSAAMQHSSGGGSVSTPASDFAVSRKASEQGLSHIKEEKEQLGTVASPKMEALPEVSPNHLVDDDGVKYQIFDESPELTFEDVVPAAIQCQSVPEEVFMEAEPGKQSDTGSTFDFHLSGQIHVSDQVLPQNVVDGSNKEADAIFMTESHASPHVDPVEITSEFMFSPLTSDQEDQLFEDTDDVPCFSDVETMILDMDLGSCIPDLYSSKEALRHQYEHSGRAIIRLEQGAYSCIQRAIASRRAFALLYSRHLRHYIKKPEVLLGRTTVDVSVDIDLGRGEGCANKISRRQATIKMDENGSFYMKNLGKCSVLVNSKELKTGQRVKLSSNCLIEISGIQFLFEINQNIVRQHLDEEARRINGNSSKFERLPGRVS